MKYTTTPYYAPKIQHIPPPPLKKKRFPLFHVIICFVVILAYLGVTLYSLATTIDFISKGGLYGILFALTGLGTASLLSISAFLLIRKRKSFVWFFLGTFVFSFVMKLLVVDWDLQKYSLSVESMLVYGAIAIVFLCMIPLFGSLSDKLKLVEEHAELF